MKNNQWCGILLSFLAVAGLGCELVEDQQFLTADRRALVNPKPLVQNAIEQNARHKVLVAVIDSGVDYLHPALQNNLHFQLDDKGVPVRWGWDYVGNDPWPSPYLARSVDLYPRVSDQDRRLTEFSIKMYEDGLRLVPDLQGRLHPLRLHIEEKSVFHGTHVAGLLTYDRPEIGLLAYRVLPINATPIQGLFPSFSELKKFRKNSFDNIVQSVEKAIEDGARVINFSLGARANKACVENGFSEKDCSEIDRDFYRKMTNVIRSHPEVVFVAAAGNDGVKFTGGEVLPCGFHADNLVCVGAMRTQNAIADFSNVALDHKNFVLAPGVEILSLTATQVCESRHLPGNEITSSYFRKKIEERKALWQKVLEDCRETQLFKTASGTSMATPLIARQLALVAIQHPEKQATEWIAEFFKKAEPVEIAGQMYRRIDVEVPSWMTEQNKDLWLRTSGAFKRQIPFIVP